MVKVQVGQPLGEIYGPVWEGVTADGGNQFRDVNGDGRIKYRRWKRIKRRL